MSHTLGVHGLAPGEAGLVRALLSLAGVNDPAWSWKFVTSGPCDVLLADGAAAAVGEALVQRKAQALFLVDGESADPRRLSRPLRAEVLERALRKLTAPTEAPMGVEAVPTPALGVGSPTPPRYKLLRWPPAELFQGQPQRIRMATHLTRRYLSCSELASLAGTDAERCALFLRLLQGFRLLDQEPAAPTVRAAEVSAGEGKDARRGLVGSIRRRLGI